MSVMTEASLSGMPASISRRTAAISLSVLPGAFWARPAMREPVSVSSWVPSLRSISMRMISLPRLSTSNGEENDRAKAAPNTSVPRMPKQRMRVRMRKRCRGLSTLARRHAQRGQQPRAGVFHQVQHVLETPVAAVVGVGHFARGVLGAEVRQPLYAVPFGLGANPARCRFVGAIHHQHLVECREVFGPQLPRALLRKVIAAPRGMGLGAAGGGLAHPGVGGARGGHLGAGSPGPVGPPFFEDALGRRGAAGVSPADHEES